MNILNYNSESNMDKILEKLKEGKLIVYPTDTIYGIAADINNIDAVKKVYSTKKRSLTKPLSVSFHDLNQLKNYVILNPALTEIIEKLLPGPYTFLLYKKENVDSIITANSPKIGVRIPDNKVAYKLSEQFPITSTSANISNQKTPDNIHQIQEELGDNIDCYIDAGIMRNNQASTIIDLTNKKPQILRKGLCDEKLLRDILKINL